MSQSETLIVGLVSISDRASTGIYEDKGIPALQDWLGAALTTPWRAETRLIADDQPSIEATLKELVDQAYYTRALSTLQIAVDREPENVDALIVAVGSEPLIPPIPGLKDDHVIVVND